MNEWENLPAATRAAFGRAVLDSLFPNPNAYPGCPVDLESMGQAAFEAAKALFAELGAPGQFCLARFDATETVFGMDPNRVTWSGTRGFALAEGCTPEFAEAFRRIANA